MIESFECPFTGVIVKGDNIIGGINSKILKYNIEVERKILTISIHHEFYDALEVSYYKSENRDRIKWKLKDVDVDDFLLENKYKVYHWGCVDYDNDYEFFDMKALKALSVSKSQKV